MKKHICVILTFVLLLQSFSFMASASGTLANTDLNDYSACSDSDYGIAPCAYVICSCGGTAALRCGYYHLGSSNYSYCYDSETHSSGKCTIKYYKSAGVYKCSSCGTKTNSGLYHYCYETHSYCGKGTVVECDLALSGL